MTYILIALFILFLSLSPIIYVAVFPPRKKDGYYVVEGSDFRTSISSSKQYFKKTYSKITEIVLPKSIKYIECYENNIKELIIPKGVIWMECEKNDITKLSLPKSLEEIWCDMMDEIEEQHKKNLNIHIYQKK